MQQTVLLGGGGCLYGQSCVNEFRTVDNYICLQGLFQGLSLRAKAGTKDLSPVLKESLQRRVDYKLACFVFSSLSGHAPPYLADDIHLVSKSHRRRLRSSTDRSCAVPCTHNTLISATGASLSPGHVFRTVFRPTCATSTLHTAVSDVNSKRFCFNVASGAQ